MRILVLLLLSSFGLVCGFRIFLNLCIQFNKYFTVLAEKRSQSLKNFVYLKVIYCSVPGFFFISRFFFVVSPTSLMYKSIASILRSIIIKQYAAHSASTKMYVFY